MGIEVFLAIYSLPPIKAGRHFVVMFCLLLFLFEVEVFLR